MTQLKYYEHARRTLKNCGAPLDQVNAVARAFEELERIILETRCCPGGPALTVKRIEAALQTEKDRDTPTAS